MHTGIPTGLIAVQPERQGNGRLQRLSVVIPARNEAGCIASTVEHLHCELRLHGIPHEIVVVDDGSTDDTWAILVSKAATIDELAALRNPGPHGFGNAIRTGLAAMTGDAVVIMMADESDDCRDVVRYWNTLQRGYDCVFGSRFMKQGGTIDCPWIRWIVNRAANLFIRVLFGIGLNDTTNAFKAYRREVIEGCGPLLSQHFDFAVELPLKAVVRGYSWTSIPVTWRHRRTCLERAKIGETGSRYLFTVGSVWLEKHFGQGGSRRRHDPAAGDAGRLRDPSAAPAVDSGEPTARRTSADEEPARLSRQPERRSLQTWAVAAVVAIMAAVLVCKVFAVPAPIYASDEYAYWRSGVMLHDRAALYAADGRIQRIDNKAYCAFLYACDALAPGNLLLPALANTAAWLATVGCVFLTARLLVPTRKAVIAAGMTAVMPSGLMAGTLMPDVLYGLMFWLLVYTVVFFAADARKWWEVPVGAALLAIQMAVKPHAVALVAAFIVYVATRASIGFSRDVRSVVRAGILPLMVAGVAFGLVHFGVEGLEPAAGGSGAVGFGATYNGFVGRALSPSFLWAHAVAMFREGAPHAIVLLLFFSLPAAYLLAGRWPFASGGVPWVAEESPRHRAFCHFIRLCLVSTVAMTVVFSTIAGAANEFERHRLHERYYWFLLPALIVVGFMAEEYCSRKPFFGRLAGAVMLGAWAVYQLVTHHDVRLFPWDAPDLFALYHPLNRYWAWPTPVPWSQSIVLGAVFLAGAVAIYRPWLAWPCAAASLWTAFVAGWLGVVAWQIGASRDHASRLSETRAVAMLVGDGPVQAIGSAPYGPFSANLFAFRGNPYVGIHAKAVVESKDVAPAARAVFVEGAHDFRHPYAWKIGCRTGTMYALVDQSDYGVARASRAESTPACDFVCRLTGNEKNVALFGFNSPEAWGAWTARSDAEVILPEGIRGKVRVTVKAWVPEQCVGSDVTLRLGGATMTHRMGTTLAPYVGECELTDAVDRIVIMSEIAQPNAWDRPLGVAINELRIETSGTPDN